MKIGILTAGGIAPCLSASIGRLIQQYTKYFPQAEIIGYLHGYKGLLLGNSIKITEQVRQNAELLYKFGGTPLGNSRVKLTNTENCKEMGYIKDDENPLEVASKQLQMDGITILHTIGGDDTNTSASDLSDYLSKHNYSLTVVGLPKTVDNDVYPIQQTLGAWTASEQGAIFFENIVNENTTSSRQLIIHEIMGRNCGWLTAETAREYRSRLSNRTFLPEVLVEKSKWDIDAVYIPEMKFNIELEAIRLKKIMDRKDCVNIFLSEGAGLDGIVKEMKRNNEEVRLDAFGHVRLDEINPGQWFAIQFSKMLDSDKVLVQKSGYFARSAIANNQDLDLIKRTADLAVKFASKGQSGVIGLDEEDGGKLNCIDFSRIKGGKPFDVNKDWFVELLQDIGQEDKS